MDVTGNFTSAQTLNVPFKNTADRNRIVGTQSRASNQLTLGTVTLQSSCVLCARVLVVANLYSNNQLTSCGSQYLCKRRSKAQSSHYVSCNGYC